MYIFVYAATAEISILFAFKIEFVGTPAAMSHPSTKASLNDKRTFRTDSNSVKSHDSNVTYNKIPCRENAAGSQSASWKATWMRFGPLAGLFCIFLVLCSIFASLAILLTSDGAPVRLWTLQPSTWLAIVTAVANQAMRYAALQGFAIAWWAKALKGSTLGKLHRDWDTSNSIWSSLAAGRHTNILSVACIFSTLVAVDGPLLQRATTVAFEAFNDPVSLNVSIAPETPYGFTGTSYYTPPPKSESIFHGKSYDWSLGQSDGFFDISMRWLNDDRILGQVTGCGSDTCRAKVQGPMLTLTKCTESTFPLDPPTNVSELDLHKSWGGILFYVDIGLVRTATEEFINYTVGYREPHQCSLGRIKRRNCELHSAIGLYDIVTDGSTIDLPPNKEPEMLALANNTSSRPGDNSSDGNAKSTLAGIAAGADEAFTTLVTVTKGNKTADNGNSWNAYGFTEFTQKFIIPFTPSRIEACNATSSRTLGVNAYRDPTDYILGQLNNLMFRIGVETASKIPHRLPQLLESGLKIQQSVNATQFGHHNVYVTNFNFYLAAALIEILCICCVLPTYWGWWRLGRDFTFSPLEIAKAFQAPLLRDCPSNASGDSLVKVVDDVPVRYGAIGKASGRGQEYEVEEVAFASPDHVYHPFSSS